LPENHDIACYAATEAKAPLKAHTYTPKPLGPWEVEIKISHCGICHSDLHLINDDWKVGKFPLVPGHEIVGEVAAKGDAVQHLEVGMRVGVGWQCQSCHKCEWCLTGQENLCLHEQDTCVGRHGGFAQAIHVDSRFAFPLPEALASETAAPLLCGGATTFSPFIEHGISALHRVAIIGVGGLGHLGIQFARAFGCEVTALSSSPDKEEEAMALGADHFLPSQDPKAFVHAAGSFDLILSTATGKLPWADYIKLLRPKGKLCLVGIADNPLNLSPMQLVAFRRTVCGSNIASPLLIQKMLHFAARHGIAAKTELFKISDVNTALEKMARNQLHYRAVLQCAPWS